MPHLDEEPTLAALQRYVAALEVERGFDHQTTLEKCLLLGEELGELFRAVRHARGMAVDAAAAAATSEALGGELADAFIYLCAIANREGVDLEAAFRAKEAVNAARTWVRAPRVRAGEVVTRLWTALEARDFEAVRALLHPDFELSWVQSGERFGRDAFIAMNAAYPGDWHITVERVSCGGDWATSEVRVAIDGRTDWATSVCHLRDGLIHRVREVWAEPFPVPDWRSALSETPE